MLLDVLAARDLEGQMYSSAFKKKMQNNVGKTSAEKNKAKVLSISLATSCGSIHISSCMLADESLIKYDTLAVSPMLPFSFP